MKTIILLISTLMTQTSYTIFDFDKTSNLSSWRVVNDGVMGGLSQGNFDVNDDGHGKFHGVVRLENNGGFSSVRYSFDTVDVSKYSTVCIKLKGDGKKYQFRVKPERTDYFSYITTFETSGEWQTIEVKLSDMYPSFRGRKLSAPNFSAATIEELVFLIGNKKKEDFELLIDTVELR